MRNWYSKSSRPERERELVYQADHRRSAGGSDPRCPLSRCVPHRRSSISVRRVPPARASPCRRYPTHGIPPDPKAQLVALSAWLGLKSSHNHAGIAGVAGCLDGSPLRPRATTTRARSRLNLTNRSHLPVPRRDSCLTMQVKPSSVQVARAGATPSMVPLSSKSAPGVASQRST